MEAKNLCPNCKNPVRDTKVCVYCLVPFKVKQAKPKASRIRFRGFRIIPIILLTFAAISFLPTIKRIFFVPPQVKVVPQKKPVSYITEVTALDAYQNMRMAINNSDENRAWRYITKARLKYLELESNPSAVHDLNGGCLHRAKLTAYDNNDRSLLIAKGNSLRVQDDQGKPAPVIYLVKMIKEDGQWKVLSLDCRYLPPVGLIEEAMGWLNGETEY